MTSYLLTGGTGSFGRAFTKRLLDTNASDRICIYSRGEHQQADFRREVGDDHRCRWLIGDVRDQNRLRRAMAGVDVVVHAAALKRIEVCEADPAEAIKTNILGTQNVVDAALDCGVKKVMALSTDKASAGFTLYGATKFCAERLVVASNVYSGATGTRFSCVRYGNVEASRGSVIPYFRSLVENGADYLPITHQDMTRFFFTIEEAVEFTMTSIAMMSGGEVFIPKIAAKRIVDLAREIGPGLPHKIVGMRAGEKIHEVLISEDESRFTLEMADRYVLKPLIDGWDYSHLTGAKPVDDGFKFTSDSAIVTPRAEAAE